MAGFADTFAFVRLREAPVRNLSGLVEIAPPNTARFDHGLDGTPRGLLVEGRPDTTAADKVRVIATGWQAEEGTVLHELEHPDGRIERRAYYTTDAQRTVDACLLAKGWQRRIAYFPQILTAIDGEITWRGGRYRLPTPLADGEGAALGEGGNAIGTG